MATIYSGPGGSVTMTPVNLPQAMRRLVQATIRGAVKGGKQSLKDIKVILQDGIKNNSLGLDPLADSTKIARANPPPGRPRKLGSIPLLYSAETVRGIKVLINGNSMALDFDPGATISYNRSNMSKVAYYHEYGFTIRGTYTKKQLAYLHILFRKQFGKKIEKERNFVRARGWAGKGREGTHIGVSYSRDVAARPAWERATQKALPIIEINFTTAIVKEIQKTGLVA